eukprot:TRINITY_DN102420_c0_g1_i1.p1 TRINITY_DN102420_c0_g1~~TRINITY_DN102420_c0_g1_i1.p1  ORF type:complete len:157 (-),score=19.05 TRINITY_DN102420_c0_g1_i1:149-619(-)
MRSLGQKAGIELDYNVQANWQPVDSQRVMLWAAKQGKAEQFMSKLARKHFEERKSASHRSTILEAAEESGLRRDAVNEFLDGDEFKATVWSSYGSTIEDKGIHAIPYFVFNDPLTGAGGPFRRGDGKPHVVQGSGDPEQFLSVFEKILGKVQGASL